MGSLAQFSSVKQQSCHLLRNLSWGCDEMLYRQCLTRLSAAVPNVLRVGLPREHSQSLGAPGGPGPACNWPRGPILQHLPQGKYVQARAFVHTGDIENPAWEAYPPPSPNFRLSSHSAPYTEPSRTSPAPGRSLVSLPAPVREALSRA